MNEDIVIMTPEQVRAVREELEQCEVSALSRAWLVAVSGAMVRGECSVDTMTLTISTAARVVNEAVERLAEALKQRGWVRVWWTPAQLTPDHGLMSISSSTFSGSSIVRLHWSEHPEPKAVNDPGNNMLGWQAVWAQRG
jgi:hypothetical protein